jgi:hypothetical protein
MGVIVTLSGKKLQARQQNGGLEKGRTMFLPPILLPMLWIRQKNCGQENGNSLFLTQSGRYSQFIM